MKLLRSSLVALSLLVGFAPVAGADSSADYLSILDTAKVSYSNPATAINIGNSICQKLHSNAAPEVAAQAALDAGYNGETAGRILYAASHALCPDTAAAVDKWGSTP
jgi:Protein of unknown function (DUF732)